MELSPTVLIWAPIGLLFLTAIIGIVIERHRKDGCLKSFNGDFVFIKMKDGQFIWGKLRVFPSCLELTYDTPQPMGIGRSKASYVFYDKKIAEIERIYRPAPVAESQARREWEEEIADLRSLGFLKRIRRSIRNGYGMLKDAFSQSVGLLVGVVKQRSDTMKQVGGSDKHATEVGQSLLKVLPHAYEPVFESYRGSLVVLESVSKGEIQETVGVLDDYTVGNILIRSVELAEQALPPALVERSFDLCDVIFPRTVAIVRHRIAETEV
ncbi:hypothetical protein IEN85_17340 [Pelagicoccus sp. NFK12]|uniref:Uncharacterized protein n=1 Tax=Pelagicoccus enzymogenes TaxID=2773457 RepID=A0A927FA25_9BACT|nr:hypothetical protein [Pelagicoccus enzymogenes]MBD5781268.1 hypothetical protein [Pelagicoccus enzymogenes]MDQ8198829.1 hypothetical protein [Pelagicoccus enzymogenes]